MVNIDVTCFKGQGQVFIFSQRKKNTNTCNLFVEGIPLRVDTFQVVLEFLSASAFSSILDQTLPEGIDVLKLVLQWINVLFLKSLNRHGTNHNEYFRIAQNIVSLIFRTLFPAALKNHIHTNPIKLALCVWKGQIFP